ncbi:MAG: MaoC/PaaZ C-terminal domain-containing protein [SAR324 cluster bacterium]|nr:MaoC/PaaZ C-terminal domain-containing protein [SAR324 cluster bacterium]MCZ6627709.1 MaoC/PaaZ C-terminal domain-containing protein [SAR324 cluster bacterium]MCZ6646014.1 MaoC/PaaZ C-terminal domain-containing protein [SAR324 cluster bacterium]MCZ6729710.1 MaoC/PaaZ C-terminal domain-containing protein [SAR324 cluster bacterium]MCZ6841950.1 MaoC/PaaZ C-terminal domain-containing protein [SAR324 cluster bacterium]
MRQLYFEDFNVGDSFASPSKTISDAHFVAFVGLTGDNHPIHYDIEYCRKRGYPERLSHGLLNVAQTALGASELAAQVHECMIAFLEQSSRFLAPVYVGDTLSPLLTVSELIPKNSTGILKMRTTLHNQRDELVLEGEHVYLVKKRESGAK